MPRDFAFFKKNRQIQESGFAWLRTSSVPEKLINGFKVKIDGKELKEDQIKIVDTETKNIGGGKKNVVFKPTRAKTYKIEITPSYLQGTGTVSKFTLEVKR
jgi:hypothetical protein